MLLSEGTTFQSKSLRQGFALQGEKTKKIPSHHVFWVIWGHHENIWRHVKKSEGEEMLVRCSQSDAAVMDRVYSSLRPHLYFSTSFLWFSNFFLWRPPRHLPSLLSASPPLHAVIPASLDLPGVPLFLRLHHFPSPVFILLCFWALKLPQPPLCSMCFFIFNLCLFHHPLSPLRFSPAGFWRPQKSFIFLLRVISLCAVQNNICRTRLRVNGFELEMFSSAHDNPCQLSAHFPSGHHSVDWVTEAALLLSHNYFLWQLTFFISCISWKSWLFLPRIHFVKKFSSLILTRHKLNLSVAAEHATAVYSNKKK